MTKLTTCVLTLVFVCGLTTSAWAGVDPGARDSIWLEDVVWDGDTSFSTDLYTETDDSLKHATIILTWSSNQIQIDSVSLLGSRWASQVLGGNGFFVATPGEVGGVPSDVHYNISFLPFGQLLPTGSGLACRIHWSKTTTVTEELITVDTSTTSSGPVVNTTLFGTSPLEDDNFVPAFDGSVIDAVLCNCPSQADINSDQALDAVDMNTLIDIVYFGQTDVQDPQCPTSRTDLNCDNVPDAVDVNLMINLLFFGGDDPCDPCQP
ncbi:MAG: hypothetical protein Kow0074_25510 [Candidatus Zixiibacteriota bacterium]